jgi:hypothetical protein
MIFILSIIAGLALISLTCLALTEVHRCLTTPVKITYRPWQVRVFIIEMIVVAASLIWVICFR